MKQLSLSVRGVTPVPWGCGKNEWDWRGVLAAEGRLVRALEDLAPLSQWALFSVDITFFMSPHRAAIADLDNLAKPVLDTLFQIKRPQVKDLSLTGALFNVDDARVFGLTLQKKPVDTLAEEGADITVRWLVPGEE